MKVLVVCTTGGSGRRQFGGAEHLLVDLLPALSSAGIEVFAGTPDDAVGAALRDAGVAWIELGARRRFDPSYVRTIRRAIREVQPDVVCAHLLSAAMHCRAALGTRDRGLPLVVTLHNSLWQYRQTAPSFAAKARVQLNIAMELTMRRLRPHMSVAVSEYEAAELRQRARASAVRVIPNPLPPAWPAPPAAVDSRPRTRVGFLGRLEREKGADLLGDIARALPEADFAIAGSGTVAVPKLSNVELVGEVDAATFLRTVDCLVVPSRVESFGKSALEALSLGVPVVHTGVGGLAEVTAHAGGVLAFATDREPAAIGTAIRKATEPGAPAAERLTVAGWYQREYAFDRAVQRWSDLYRSVAVQGTGHGTG